MTRRYVKEATAYLSGLTATELERSADDIAEKGLYASVGLHEVRKLARELLRLARCGTGEESRCQH